MVVPRSWIAADVVRFEDGKLAEHWDVLQDEVTQAESLSGLPMFGDRFPAGSRDRPPQSKDTGAENALSSAPAINAFAEPSSLAGRRAKGRVREWARCWSCCSR